MRSLTRVSSYLGVLSMKKFENPWPKSIFSGGTTFFRRMNFSVLAFMLKR